MTPDEARVYVVGAGRVGTALLAALDAAGERCAGWSRGQGPPPPDLAIAEIVVLAVRDAAIADVADMLLGAGRLTADQVVLHCAGAHPAATVLGALRGRVRAVGTLHPLRAFSAGTSPEDLRNTAYGIEGDAAAGAAARELVHRLGGRALEVPSDALPLYHAAAVMASNYVVALADAAAELLGRAVPGGGPPLAALLPLIESAVAGLAREGLPRALTGPLARGDAVTVRAHLRAIAARAPQLEDLYRACGLRAVEVAEGCGEADPAGLDEARVVLATRRR